MELSHEKKSAIQGTVKKFSLSLVLLILIFIGCLWALLLVADMVFEDKNLSFDEHIFALIHPYINGTNTVIIEVITFLGSQNFLLPANILLILFFLFIKKDKHDAWKVTAVAVTSTIVLFLLKFLLQRERPLVPLISKAHGYSFPSGHTFSSVVFYGMIAYIAYKNIKNKLVKWLVVAALVMLTFMVGFSRVYLKLHYASDVIAGFCLGIIWLLLAKWLLLKAEKMTPVKNKTTHNTGRTD
ncbi:MAG: phosphatase PAP2 family protein [Ferruginibacter sp.]